jgi:hypothetical protein
VPARSRPELSVDGTQAIRTQHPTDLAAIRLEVRRPARLRRRGQFHDRHQIGIALDHLPDEGDELLLTAPCEQGLQRRDDPKRLRLVDIGEQQGNEMLADATT